MITSEIITLAFLCLCGGYFFGLLDADQFEHKRLTGIFAFLLFFTLVAAIVLITLRVNNYIQLNA